MGVVTAPYADWPVPGRYGWSGGCGTSWFSDPHRGIIAMAMTQVSPLLGSARCKFEVLRQLGSAQESRSAPALLLDERDRPIGAVHTRSVDYPRAVSEI
jgi:CubicO group peptidase (beta-lactamase class C family)